MADVVNGPGTVGNVLLSATGGKAADTKGFFGGWFDDRFGSKVAILISIGGTATAFLGPALVDIATAVFHSQRVGFASGLLLLGTGLALILLVKEERAEAAE